MRSDHRLWVLSSALLLAACGSNTPDTAKKDAEESLKAKDALAANVDGPVQTPADAAPDRVLPDRALDAPASDIGLPDQATPAQGEAGRPDGTLPDAREAVEAGPPPVYICRNDSDCCVWVDSCKARAYLYSLAPGASPRPSIPPSSGNPSECSKCYTPAIQVRCEDGLCVGEKINQGYENDVFTKDHCGFIPRDAGSSSTPDSGSSSRLDGGGSSSRDGGSSSSPKHGYGGTPESTWGC